MLDSGNPVWALEDPHVTLEAVAPYVLTSHVRDSAVWRSPEGAVVAWTRMGEGNIGIESYLRRYQELCPAADLARDHRDERPQVPVLRSEVLGRYRNVPAWDIRALCRAGGKGTAATGSPARAQREQPAARARRSGSLDGWLKKFLGVA